MDLPASMYLNYLARRKADHARLTEILASGQSNARTALEEFKTLGHQIKGNAVSFGFDDLVVIGEQMEKLDDTMLSIEGGKLLGDFKVWIEATEKRLERELANEEGSF